MITQEQPRVWPTRAETLDTVLSGGRLRHIEPLRHDGIDIPADQVERYLPICNGHHIPEAYRGEKNLVVLISISGTPVLKSGTYLEITQEIIDNHRRGFSGFILRTTFEGVNDKAIERIKSINPNNIIYDPQFDPFY